MIDLKGQTALVTGASRGLGYAIAHRLATQGAIVHLVARGAAGVEEAAQKIAAETGATTVAHAADIADAAAVQGVFDAVPDLDILVNNAGITRDGLLMRMKEEDFDEVIRVNLRSVFLCSRAAVKAMMKRRYGRIVNLTSIVGVHGQAGQTNYAASKAGIIGFTKATAKEVATRGITCNAIAPGFIESDMTSVLSEAQKTGILTSIPQGRMGQPTEIADLTAYLCSRESAYITGQVLSIDGGMGI